LRFQPKLMGEPFIGLTGADGARESRPEPGVSSDMHAAWPASICGLSNFNRPSASSSSQGSVANMLCKVGSTRKPSRNASYSATSSRAWRVSSASTARAKTGSFATAARNTPRSRCLHASSSPASEGKSQYGVRPQRHNGRTDADCQSTSATYGGGMIELPYFEKGQNWGKKNARCV